MKPKNALSGLSMAVILQFGVLASSAQTNKYLFSGSETNITLNAGTYIMTAFAVASSGSIVAESSPLGLSTNTVERTAAVGSLAPVPVPEPSEKAVQFYRSGIAWWLVNLGWSWFIPALVLLSGFSGWLGRHAKRIGRWEVCATFVFVLLYTLIVYVL